MEDLNLTQHHMEVAPAARVGEAGASALSKQHVHSSQGILQVLSFSVNIIVSNFCFP